MSYTSQQLALARAVTAQRRARLLEPDNTATAPVPLHEAVESGRSYFVVPRADLMVVDADLPDDPAAAAERAAAFDLLVESADRAGVAHVVVASGRAGHRHAYLLMGTGQARAMAEEWCRARGLDLRDRGIRPPGAPHRDGRHVAAPISPTDIGDVIATLNQSVNPNAALRLARRLMPIELPARMRSALRHGHAAAGYESPSHARMALAVAIRSRSGPRVLLELLLGDSASPLGQTFRARPERWRQQELRRLWDKAGQWLSTRPDRSRASGDIDRWAAALASATWKGMAGGTDVAICEALLMVARRAGVTSVGAALADLAVDAGVGLDTARSSVRRLVAAGWLEVVAEATPRTSRVYRLRVPSGVVVDVEDPGPDFSRSGAVGSALGHDLGADLARWRALGKITMRLARVLAGATSDVVSLATELKMSRAAVRYHLRKLARFGLAQAHGDGHSQSWSMTAEEAVVEDLSLSMGVAGRREHERRVLTEQRRRRAQVLHGYRMAWMAGLRSGRSARSASVPGEGLLTRRPVLLAS